MAETRAENPPRTVKSPKSRSSFECILLMSLVCPNIRSHLYVSPRLHGFFMWSLSVIVSILGHSFQSAFWNLAFPPAIFLCITVKLSDLITTKMPSFLMPFYTAITSRCSYFYFISAYHSPWYLISLSYLPDFFCQDVNIYLRRCISALTLSSCAWFRSFHYSCWEWLKYASQDFYFLLEFLNKMAPRSEVV